MLSDCLEVFIGNATTSYHSEADGAVENGWMDIVVRFHLKRMF